MVLVVEVDVGTDVRERKVGGGRASGISNAYNQPPNLDLILVESGGKLYDTRI